MRIREFDGWDGYTRPPGTTSRRCQDFTPSSSTHTHKATPISTTCTTTLTPPILRGDLPPRYNNNKRLTVGVEFPNDSFDESSPRRHQSPPHRHISGFPETPCGPSSADTPRLHRGRRPHDPPAPPAPSNITIARRWLDGRCGCRVAPEEYRAEIIDAPAHVNSVRSSRITCRGSNWGKATCKAECGAGERNRSLSLGCGVRPHGVSERPANGERDGRTWRVHGFRGDSTASGAADGSRCARRRRRWRRFGREARDDAAAAVGVSFNRSLAQGRSGWWGFGGEDGSNSWAYS